MRFNTYISSHNDISTCIEAANIGEVLIEPAALARVGRLSMAQAVDLAQAATAKGLRPVLVWDALMPQRVLDEVLQSLTSTDLNNFAAVRVSDPGVAFWLFEYKRNCPIQFIAETGNHNLEALKGWQEALSPALERFILSIELPEEKLVEYCRTLTVECEVLGAGRILLFYSPRSLIAQHANHKEPPTDHMYLDGAVRPQKSLNRSFPTVETKHGTFMYLDKDQFILDRLEALRHAGLAMLRIDLRHLSRGHDSATHIGRVCDHIFTEPSSLRKSWPRPTRAPFFKTNRTTAQFSRMKSFLHELRDERCLAEIVGGENGKYVVFQTLRAFETDEIEAVVLPTGEEVVVPSRTVFRDRDGQEIRTCFAEQIIVSGWIKKAASGALLKGRE